MTPQPKMNVRYVHEQDGFNGNILWVGRWPMRNGTWPTDHPCANGPGDMPGGIQFGNSTAMAAFRARGYWASCFPEGDGITMSCERGQDEDQVVRDIEECFGWAVVED